MTRLYFDFHPCHFEENRKIIAEEDIDMPEDGAWLSWIDNKYQIERARLKIDAQDHFYPGTKLLDERNIIGWIKNNPLIQEIQDEKEIYNIGFDDGVKAYKNLIELEKEEKEEDAEDCISRETVLEIIEKEEFKGDAIYGIERLPSVTPTRPTGRWIPCTERLPETDNKDSINNYNVLLWVKNKTHPEKEPQIYLGKLRRVSGDNGSGNFWGIETKPCDWTIWGWSYFNEPEVVAWMPLPEPYKAESEE